MPKNAKKSKRQSVSGSKQRGKPVTATTPSSPAAAQSATISPSSVAHHRTPPRSPTTDDKPFISTPVTSTPADETPASAPTTTSSDVVEKAVAASSSQQLGTNAAPTTVTAALSASTDIPSVRAEESVPGDRTPAPETTGPVSPAVAVVATSTQDVTLPASPAIQDADASDGSRAPDRKQAALSSCVGTTQPKPSNADASRCPRDEEESNDTESSAAVLEPDLGSMAVVPPVDDEETSAKPDSAEDCVVQPADTLTDSTAAPVTSIAGATASPVANGDSVDSSTTATATVAEPVANGKQKTEEMKEVTKKTGKTSDEGKSTDEDTVIANGVNGTVGNGDLERNVSVRQRVGVLESKVAEETTVKETGVERAAAAERAATAAAAEREAAAAAAAEREAAAAAAAEREAAAAEAERAASAKAVAATTAKTSAMKSVPTNTAKSASKKVTEQGKEDGDKENDAKQAIELQDVEFRWGYCEAQAVELAGTYNGWKPEPLKPCDDGVHVGSIQLPAGKHLYKFVVDGRWCYDVTKETECDAEGNVNNVLVVV